VNAAELKRAKRDVRRRVLATRDAISSAERERLGVTIADRAAALPELEDVGTAMAFWSFGSEVPTGPLLDRLSARGIRLALPRIVERELEPRLWRPGDPMTETTFGALEPAAGAVLDPADLDAIVTPAVAFDRSGRRIGYGGGFYDRLLARARPDAVRVGIGFGVQLSSQELPGGRFDLRVDVVVTETEIVRCRGPLA
jgi:5-formyltetrahydrofolate cyclo-ligase